MKVLRFMSKEEATKLFFCERLVNNTDHSKSNNSMSKGFCFWIGDNPKDAFMYLCGIVSQDICVVFDVDVKDSMYSFGTYADIYSDDFFATTRKKEICVSEYSISIFKPLCAYLPICEGLNWEKFSFETACFLVM